MLGIIFPRLTPQRRRTQRLQQSRTRLNGAWVLISSTGIVCARVKGFSEVKKSKMLNVLELGVATLCFISICFALQIFCQEHVLHRRSACLI